MRQDRHRVGADLVGDVAVGGGAVGAHDDAVDETRLHHVTDHVVGDQGRGDVLFLELPRRQARALEIRPRFAAVDADALVGFDGGAHDAERGAVSGRREGAGIAVREDRRAVLDERRAVRAEGAIGGDVLVVDGAGLALQHQPQGLDVARVVLRVDAPHALDGPEEIHGRRSGCREGAADLVELAAELFALQPAHTERDAHGGRDADGRRAADHHVFDRARDLTIVAVDAIDFTHGQQTLIDHDDSTARPLDRTYTGSSSRSSLGHGSPSSSDRRTIACGSAGDSAFRGFRSRQAARWRRPRARPR